MEGGGGGREERKWERECRRESVGGRLEEGGKEHEMGGAGDTQAKKCQCQCSVNSEAHKNGQLQNY